MKTSDSPDIETTATFLSSIARSIVLRSSGIYITTAGLSEAGEPFFELSKSSPLYALVNSSLPAEAIDAIFQEGDLPEKLQQVVLILRYCHAGLVAFEMASILAKQSRLENTLEYSTQLQFAERVEESLVKQSFLEERAFEELCQSIRCNEISMIVGSYWDQLTRTFFFLENSDPGFRINLDSKWFHIPPDFYIGPREAERKWLEAVGLTEE